MALKLFGSPIYFGWLILIAGMLASLTIAITELDDTSQLYTEFTNNTANFTSEQGDKIFITMLMWDLITPSILNDWNDNGEYMFIIEDMPILDSKEIFFLVGIAILLYMWLARKAKIDPAWYYRGLLILPLAIIAVYLLLKIGEYTLFKHYVAQVPYLDYETMMQTRYSISQGQVGSGFIYPLLFLSAIVFIPSYKFWRKMFKK